MEVLYAPWGQCPRGAGHRVTPCKAPARRLRPWKFPTLVQSIGRLRQNSALLQAAQQYQQRRRHQSPRRCWTRHLVLRTQSNTSCFVEVFGEGFKICEDESAIKRLASGNFYALEECDDGNRISGDGCSETCSVESRSKEQNFLSHLLPTGNLHNSPVSEGVGGGEIEGFLLLHRLQAVDRVHPSTGWIQLSYGQNQLKTASYVKGIYRQVTGEIR
jgi:cysteine-rich repeat protein